MNATREIASMSQDYSTPMVEGIARVVRVEPGWAWLEPEQTTSCGSCASSASCGSHGAAGIGSVASRLQSRRFRLDNPAGPGELREGERVVVGVQNSALLKAAVLAYGFPLAAALCGGGIAQSAYESDPLSMLGVAAGLAFGLLVARFGAHRLAVRGEATPRFLRRARPDETCK